jgi:alpha-galactosidase
MSVTKIVIIGAGSASFGPSTLATLIRHPQLHGSQLALVDLNEQALQTTTRVAERMSEAWAAGITVSASTERQEVLPGATFVIASIEVPPREQLWRMDWEIPLKHGLRQPYGENGGPGGLMHACRQIPPFMGIIADMEALCPDAWLINFSNPLPRITRAITKYSRIKTVGKCHQIEAGYALAAVLLAERYGIDVPDGITLRSDPFNIGTKHQLAEAGRTRFDITSAGLNHFIWLLSIRDKATGEDLYPALRQAADHAPPTLEPFSLELFRIFGRCPIPGDSHLVEYLPWTHDPVAKPWKHYPLHLYDWESNEGARDFLQQMMQAMGDGRLPVEGLRDAHSEGAAEIIAAMTSNENFHDEAVNIPNQGAISNLPDQTIVEIPATVSAYGIQGLDVGPLPEPIAELCRREAALVELVVDTAVSGDRNLALQTLLLDPMINDIGRARLILDDYLRSFADYLPQFQ